MEPHLLHVFPADFYGAELRLVVTGYLRPEASFPSLDALIAAIHGDIEAARRELHAPPAAGSPEHAFLVVEGLGGGGGGGAPPPAAAPA